MSEAEIQKTPKELYKEMEDLPNVLLEGKYGYILVGDVDAPSDPDTLAVMNDPAQIPSKALVFTYRREAVAMRARYLARGFDLPVVPQEYLDIMQWLSDADKAIEAAERNVDTMENDKEKPTRETLSSQLHELCETISTLQKSHDPEHTLYDAKRAVAEIQTVERATATLLREYGGPDLEETQICLKKLKWHMQRICDDFDSGVNVTMEHSTGEDPKVQAERWTAIQEACDEALGDGLNKLARLADSHETLEDLAARFAVKNERGQARDIDGEQRIGEKRLTVSGEQIVANNAFENATPGEIDAKVRDLLNDPPEEAEQLRRTSLQAINRIHDLCRQYDFLPDAPGMHEKPEATANTVRSWCGEAERKIKVLPAYTDPDVVGKMIGLLGQLRDLALPGFDEVKLNRACQRANRELIHLKPKKFKVCPTTSTDKQYQAQVDAQENEAVRKRWERGRAQRCNEEGRYLSDRFAIYANRVLNEHRTALRASGVETKSGSSFTFMTDGTVEWQIETIATAKRIYYSLDSEHAKAMKKWEVRRDRVLQDFNTLNATDTGNRIDAWDKLESGELHDVCRKIGDTHPEERIIAAALFGDDVNLCSSWQSREELIDRGIAILETVRAEGERLREMYGEDSESGTSGFAGRAKQKEPASDQSQAAESPGRKYESETPEGKARRKTRISKVAMITAHLEKAPNATSKEVQASTGIHASDVRHIWGPIKRACQQGKRDKRRGYKHEGKTDAEDESAYCKLCKEPLPGSFWCKVCDESVTGECKTCHFTNSHPNIAEP